MGEQQKTPIVEVKRVRQCLALGAYQASEATVTGLCDIIDQERAAKEEWERQFREEFAARVELGERACSRIVELQAALEPFANITQCEDFYGDLCDADFQIARKALGRKENSENAELRERLAKEERDG